MKTMLKFMAMAAIVLPMMISCSGDGSSKSPFGSLPELYQKYDEESEKLQEEAKNIKSDKEKAEFLKKSDELKEKWAEKIEKGAKKLDGKELKLAECNFKATEPLTLQFNEVMEKGSLTSVFEIKGKAEAANDITLERNYYIPTASIYLVGYDAEGQKVYSQRVGSVEDKEVDGKSVVPAGAPVTFNTLSIGKSDAKKLADVTELKLEAN